MNYCVFIQLYNDLILTMGIRKLFRFHLLYQEILSGLTLAPTLIAREKMECVPLYHENVQM